MLTKQPDYTISELGYPQWQHSLCEDKLYKKCRPQAPNTSYCASFSSASSPNRLLPLRETLDDYYKRILLENCAARRGRDSDDVVAQQKRHKNQWNLQQQQQSRNNNHIRNQNCRDKAQANVTATTPTTTAATSTTTLPTITTTTTMKATLVTCDLNSF